MRTTAALAAAAVLAVGPVLPAADPTADVAPLVAALGSPDYRAREKAAKELAAVGDRAIVPLRAALAAGPEPEVARRLDVLLRKLDADRLTTARPVTLKIKNQTVKSALTELARVSGYAIQTDGLGDDTGRVSFDFDGVPFWKALDDVCDAAGLSANPQDDNGKLAVYFHDSYNPHVAYAGPFRIVASNLSLSQSVQLGGLQRGRPFGRQPEYLNFNFQVFSEPKVPLVGIGQAVPVKVTDDTGASMIPPPEPGQTVSYYPPQVSYKTYTLGGGLNLTRTVRSAAEIKSLTARVPLMLLSDVRPDVVIPDPLAAKGKRFAGREVDVEVANTVEQNGLVSVTLAVTRRDGPPDDYAWMNGITGRFEAYDGKGKKLPSVSVDQNNSGPNACGLTLTFAGNGGKPPPKPAKLVLVEWIHITKDVTFEFKRLPLP